MMGLASQGVIVRSGEPLAVHGVKPSGIAIAGNVVHRKATAAQEWSLLSSTSIIAPAQTSSAIDTSGAAIIIASLAYSTSAEGFGFTDNQGNTWTLGPTSVNTSTAVRNSIYFCIHPNTSASHVFTEAGSSLYASCFVAAFQGPSNIAVDQMTSNNNNNASSATNVLPAITPSADNSLLVSSIGLNSSANSIGSGFVITGNQPFVNGVVFGGAAAYLIQETAASVSPTWNIAITTFMYSAATLASFKPA